MNVFLDSNVLIDWLLNRSTGFPGEASQIMEACETERIHGFVSAPTLYLIAYLLEKAGKNKAELGELIRSVLQLVTVAPQSNSQIESGLELTHHDLEDGFQLATAMSIVNCQYLITANTRDFPVNSGNILIIHTRDFLDVLNKV